jgi:flagellar biosynthetic protein FliQ
MTQGQVLDIMRDSFYTVIVCSAPPLIVSLVVGLILSILQTVTSIQEQTLTFVPKILATFISIIIFGSFIMTTINEFVVRLWTNFSVYTRGG